MPGRMRPGCVILSQLGTTYCSSPVRDWDLQLALSQPLHRLLQGAPEDAGLIHLVAAPEDAMHREVLDQRDVGSNLQCTWYASGRVLLVTVSEGPMHDHVPDQQIVGRDLEACTALLWASFRCPI